MAATDDLNAQPDAPTDEMQEKTQAPETGCTAQADESVGNDSSTTADASANMEFLLDIPLEVTVELGRTKMLINDMLKLGQGSVIELSKLAGESLEILANQKPIARGEVVVVNDKYGVRLTEVISAMERIEGLR